MNPYPTPQICKKEIAFPFSRFCFIGLCVLFSCFSAKSQSFKTSDSSSVVELIDQTRAIHFNNHNEEKEYCLAEKAINKALKGKSTLLYARALDNLGLLYRYHKHYSEAVPLHIKAYKLVKNKDTPPLYKMIFANNTGVAARYNQNYSLSVAYYMKALKIAEKKNNLKNIAIACNGIGNALSNLPHQQKEALTYFKRSLKAEKKRNNSLGIAMNYLSISNYYKEKGNFRKAHQFLDKLLKINKKRKDTFGLALTYEARGNTYLKAEKNLLGAEFYLNKALESFKMQENRKKVTELLISLGDLKRKQGELKRAQDYYKKSLRLAKKQKNKELVKKNSFRLSNILMSKNQYKQAFHYYKQAEAYEDSIKIAKQNVKIEALTRKYNIEKKENHIKLLKKEKALQQNKLERRRKFMILMGIGILMLLIIFLLQYRNYRTKKKKNFKILEEEKATIKALSELDKARSEILVTRLRINPHFLFNSLNAIVYLIQSEQNKKATKYLKFFSRYTRMVLETSEKEVVPIKEEIELAQNYLILEEKRFKENFNYKVTGHNSPELQNVSLPPMLLQPFIENAVKHGLLPSKREHKNLNIQFIPFANGVKILIEDNGIGRKKAKEREERKKHRSMGMNIIKERIRLHNKCFDRKINYQIKDKTNEKGQPAGTCVIIELSKEKELESPR